MADTDYQAMLADMETRKALLEQAITAVKAWLTAGGLTIAGDFQVQPIMNAGVGLPGSGDIPQGAFFRKSIPDAVIAYLQAVRKRCPTNEIVQGLKKGGMVSTSKTFDIVVGNTLRRLKSEGKLLVHDDGWGLPEWVPEALRSRVNQQAKAQAKSKKKKPRKVKKTVAQKPGQTPQEPQPQKQSQTEGLKIRVENYFSTHPGAEASAKEIASTLGMSARVPLLILSNMARSGWLEKTSGGKFRRRSKVTPISKTG
jgi:hypothetical protein